MRKLLLTCWLLMWLALAGPAHADDGLVPVPPLSARVIDQVHLLQPQQRQALEGVLTEIEQRTGSQIGVLLMSSTAPEAIEQYSIRVADAWKLGRKGIDDGVILIVAKDNPKSLRRLRIEAGRGVQGSLTDAQSKRILEDVIAPHFRQNDFYGGLAAGVTAITTLLEQEKLPPVKHRTSTVQVDNGAGWIALLVIGLFLVVFFTVLLKSRRGNRNHLNNNDWGRSGDTTAGVIIGSLVDEALRQASSGRSWPRSGGGGGGFGGSSGGGFSGGGGSFDGGGASGDW